MDKKLLEFYNEYLKTQGKPPVVINNSSNQLKSLKSQLSSTDYQIIKCYEYHMAGLELPYNIQELHSAREAIREQIRELEEQI